MRYKYILSLIATATSLQCSAQTTIPSNDKHIHYMGRVAMSDSTAELSWSGTSAKINFAGAGVSVVLTDERADNSYNVIVDGKLIGSIRPVREKKIYTLAAGLAIEKHTVELFKRTEWAMGKTWLHKFVLYGNGKVLPATPTKKHKIEFFGNSITCGYADEDTSGKDRGTSTYENGYISYAAITARHFDAEFYNTSKSGIGITVSWFPLIMSEMYDRLDATDPNSKWDFSKYTPDLVVINLFQNDSWITKLPTNEQFKARFGSTAPTPEFIIGAYRNFVKSVRVKYPKAQIVCALGSMDATRTGSPWPGYIEKAISTLNDKRIATHFFPYKNTNGHPSAKEQQAMADDLIAYINEKMKW